MTTNRPLDFQAKKNDILNKLLKMSELSMENGQVLFQTWLTQRTPYKKFVEKIQEILNSLLDKYAARSAYINALQGPLQRNGLRYGYSTSLMSGYLDKYTEILAYLHKYIFELEKIYDKFVVDNQKLKPSLFPSDLEYRIKASPLMNAANEDIIPMQSENKDLAPLATTAKITLMLPPQKEKIEEAHRAMEISEINFHGFFNVNEITTSEGHSREPIKISSILKGKKKEPEKMQTRGKCVIC